MGTATRGFSISALADIRRHCASVMYTGVDRKERKGEENTMYVRIIGKDTG